MCRLQESFFRACGALAFERLEQIQRERCYGCIYPEYALNQLAHDLCMNISYFELIRRFLPEILHDLDSEKIVEKCTTEFERLHAEDESFSVGGVYYILRMYQKLMKTMMYDREIQAKIGVEMVKVDSRNPTDEYLEEFQEWYIGK